MSLKLRRLLIFTSRYVRDAPPEHLQDYVRYISTCEGEGRWMIAKRIKDIPVFAYKAKFAESERFEK